MPDSISFDALRPWNGSVANAFEELAFQLLKEDVPAGARAIRTSNPDTGVEWYATLGPNEEWAWQAKHVHNFDDLLGAMTDSVKTIARERPKTRKLTFVISSNLTPQPQGRQRLSQRQRYENKVTAWRQDISGADTIEFDLVQGSDLLDRLSRPEHRGRQWFWWNHATLDQGWLERFHDQQADAAGDRYRPDLQVDVPIAADMAALGLAQSTIREFARLRRSLLDAIRELRFIAPDSALAEACAAI